MEVTQFTYFQQAGGIDLLPVTAELTYGVERIAMYLQNVDNMFDVKWDKHVTYGQLRHPWEVEYSKYHFEQLDPAIAFRNFDTYEGECQRLLERRARAARLRVLHEGVARVQLARRARRDQRDRAPALHRPRARDGARVRACVRRESRARSASRCCRRSSARRRRPRSTASARPASTPRALAAARASSPHAEEMAHAG